MRSVFSFVAAVAALAFPAASVSESTHSAHATRQAREVHEVRVATIRAFTLFNPYPRHQARIDLIAARRTIEAPAWPTHHLLWLCIHGSEAQTWGDRDTGGNGHYGGLQMHPGWGYGTSFYASDDPQIVQENAAEAGYRASGYSHAWLEGQWGQTIGPCWQYA